MGFTFSLVQTEVNPPTVEQLRQAFRSTKGFTEADAVKIATQSFGILRRGLSHANATMLQNSLTAIGAPTAIVQDTEVPQLPEPKFTRRLDLQPQALVIYDPIGRTVPVEWQHIAMISAGIVPRSGIKAVETMETNIVLDVNAAFMVRKETAMATTHQLDSSSQRLLNIILPGGKMRFEVDGDSFQYGYLLPKVPNDPDERFAQLCRLLMERAPHASLNRGCALLRAGAPQPQIYSTKASFGDESTWLFWMAAKLKGQSQ